MGGPGAAAYGDGDSDSDGDGDGDGDKVDGGQENLGRAVLSVRAAMLHVHACKTEIHTHSHIIITAIKRYKNGSK